MKILWDVDTQFDFMKPGGKLYVKGAEKINYNLWRITNVILPSIKGKNVIAAGSVDTHTPDDPEFEVYPEHAVKGTHGWLKIHETCFPYTTMVPMDPLKPEQVKDIADHARKHMRVMFEKNTPNVGVNKNVKPFLDDVKPDAIYVYGVVTEICVKAAVEYLMNLGYNVKVISDTIKEINMYDAAKLRGQWKMITLDDVVKEIEDGQDG